MDTAEQYVVDANGHRIAVILPLAEYEKLKEDLHDLSVIAEREGVGHLSLEEMRKRL